MAANAGQLLTQVIIVLSVIRCGHGDASVYADEQIKNLQRSMRSHQSKFWSNLNDWNPKEKLLVTYPPRIAMVEFIKRNSSIFYQQSPRHSHSVAKASRLDKNGRDYKKGYNKGQTSELYHQPRLQLGTRFPNSQTVLEDSEIVEPLHNLKDPKLNHKKMDGRDKTDHSKEKTSFQWDPLVSNLVYDLREEPKRLHQSGETPPTPWRHEGRLAKNGHRQTKLEAVEGGKAASVDTKNRHRLDSSTSILGKGNLTHSEDSSQDERRKARKDPPKDLFTNTSQGEKATPSREPLKPLYTKWSNWSRCSRRCQQTRKRRCRQPSICGTALIKERRSCVGWRCQRKKTRLVPRNEASSKIKIAEKKNKTSAQPDVRLLPNYNSVFYSRWSDWLPCSTKCLTSRYRSCRYPLFCGTSVIKEEAYCYAPRSACEKWYKRHQLGPHNRKIIEKDSLPKDPWNTSRNRFNVIPSSPSNRSHGGSPLGEHHFHSPRSKVGSDPRIYDLDSYINEVTTAVPFSKHFLQRPGDRSSKQTGLHWLSKNQFKMPRRSRHKHKHRPQDSSYFASTPHRLGSVGREAYHANDVTNFDERPLDRKKVNHHSGDFGSLFPLAFGREDGLPEECGVSQIPARNWSLRIIGGKEATPGKWPWQVAILNRFKEVFCGGTLIAPQWIVTAAHCLRKRLYVRLAEHDLEVKEGQELDFRIYETVPHPLYDATTVDNDVALLRLPEPVEVGRTMAPACVPEQGAPLPLTSACTIIGWGKIRHSNFFGTDVLHEAKVPVINEELCRRVYDDYYITQNMFCAGFRKGRIDSCAGDSGGPLLCNRDERWYIYGITSFGEGCGRKGKYGIYAKVSNYRTWINDVIAAHAHRSAPTSRRSAAAVDRLSTYRPRRRHSKWRRLHRGRGHSPKAIHDN